MWATTFLVVGVCLWGSYLASEVTTCTLAADGNHYKKEILLEVNSYVYGAVVEWNTDKIYITKESIRSINEVGVWDIEKKQYSILGELPEKCRITVDQRRGSVYAGCTNGSNHGGLYIFDDNAQKFVSLTGKIENVFDVYFAEKLYYTDSNFDELYVYEHGRSRRVADLQGIPMYSFVIDRKGHRVFTYLDHVYYQLPGKVDAVRVSTDVSIYNVVVDRFGNVYGSGDAAIFLVDIANDTVIKVLEVQSFCYDFTIDKNNNFICFHWNTKRLIQWVRYEP